MKVVISFGKQQNMQEFHFDDINKQHRMTEIMKY